MEKSEFSASTQCIFLLARSFRDPTFCGIFVCGPIHFKCQFIEKKRGIFVNIVLAYRYGWVDHILHSRPQVTEETLTTHIYIQLRNMRNFDSLREEQHFAAGCTLFQ